MKCDLHVHTVHSGMCTVPLLNRICRESYSSAQHVYETLKRRGMDLVTVTDHDSIDAAEALRGYPDFFLSEEVSCRTPRGTELHVGVYDIAERDHVQLQLRRDDLPALTAYLDERRLLYSVNHIFSSLTGRRTEDDFDDFVDRFPAVEILNGQMLAAANRYAEAFAARNRKAPVAGSDAHTLASLGCTYTQVSNARDRREFMEGLKRGRGTAIGDSGDYFKLTRAVGEIGFEMLKEKRWTTLLAPLMAAIPLVTLAHLVLETVFAHKWGRRTAGALDGVPAQRALERV
jgi:predicted metal-dependent phosphoesterase TrpH